MEAHSPRTGGRNFTRLQDILGGGQLSWRGYSAKRNTAGQRLARIPRFYWSYKVPGISIQYFGFYQI